MRDFVVLADVTCDLSQEIRDEFGIKDYIRSYVSFSDGRDFRTTLDWSNISRDDFYKTISNKKIKVTTAAANPEEYYAAFKKYAEQGMDVLSMSLSSKTSSTYDVTRIAAKRVQEEFPDCNIYCFDSYRVSGGFGLLVMYAQKLKNEGKNLSEVAAWLEANKHKVHQMGPIDDLVFIARRGQITMGKAIMGNFAGVKPMGDCTRDGFVSILTKVKGIKKALELTVKYMEKIAVEPSKQYVLISHSNRPEYAEKLRGMIAESVNPERVFVSDVFTGCGPNIGPGMIGVYFLGEEISENLTVEREVMNGLLNG